MIIVIVPAFVLFGGSSIFKDKRKNTAGTINGKKITITDYAHYIKMAKVFLLMRSDDKTKITPHDVEKLGADFLILSHKAAKEKIKVNDEEVIEYIIANFFPKSNFDKAIYERYIQFLSQNYNLAISPREFEEYIRDFIKNDKLFQKHINVSVSEDEVRDIYAKDNQKAKIEYLLIAYSNFKSDSGLGPEDVSSYYEKNKALFKREAKAKMKYVIINDNDQNREDILGSLSHFDTIEKIKEKFSVEINETDFIGLNDPIKKIGWQPEINKFAFSLNKGQISPPIETENGLVIIEKTADKPAGVPSLAEIEDEVRGKLSDDRAKIDAEKFSKAIKEEIDKMDKKELTKFANEKNVEYKKIDSFKYFDYIDGIGMDVNISQVIFSLKKGEIADSVLHTAKAACILQLKDITPFDNDDFKEKKQAYRAAIEQRKTIMARFKYLDELKKESNLKISLQL